jgi:aspartate aminotransferase
MNARAFQNEVLSEAHVATIAGTSFGDMGEGFVRFSYAASKEAIAEALDRIEAFLKQR